MKTMRGFTLIEMTVTVAIAVVVVGLAVPSFRDMVASNRQNTVTNLFIASFNMARNEAITRGVNIDIAANDDASGNPNWSAGWTISFTDGGGTTTTLASYEALPTELKISGQPDITDPANPLELPASEPPLSFQYNRQGRLAQVDGAAMTSTQAITICDIRQSEAGQAIIFVPIGRVWSASVKCK